MLKFLEGKIFLTEDCFLKVEETEQLKRYAFRPNVCWKVKVIRHIKDENRLFFEIMEYRTKEVEFTEEQLSLKEKLKTIQKIGFKHIDTDRLLLSTILAKNRGGTFLNHPSIKEPLFANTKRNVGESFKYTVDESYLVSIKDIEFRNGFVSFNKRFHRYGIFRIEIFNSEIKEEFDAIKNYFANILKTKRIHVTTVINFIGSKVECVNSTSSEINLIGENFIERVKFDILGRMIKKNVDDTEKKTFYTFEEYLDKFGEKEINKHFDSEEIFFQNLLAISKTKHYRNLRFLSKQHAHLKMKLRFIQKPFSFVFLIERDKKHYIVWETLNTEEATYIWEANKNTDLLKHKVEEIESVIYKIKESGKIDYIKNNQDNLKRIYHNYSDLDKGFDEWKSEFENFTN